MHNTKAFQNLLQKSNSSNLKKIKNSLFIIYKKTKYLQKSIRFLRSFYFQFQWHTLYLTKRLYFLIASSFFREISNRRISQTNKNNELLVRKKNILSPYRSQKQLMKFKSKTNSVKGASTLVTMIFKLRSVPVNFKCSSLKILSNAFSLKLYSQIIKATVCFYRVKTDWNSPSLDSGKGSPGGFLFCCYRNCVLKSFEKMMVIEQTKNISNQNFPDILLQ